MMNEETNKKYIKRVVFEVKGNPITYTDAELLKENDTHIVIKDSMTNKEVLIRIADIITMVR